MRARFYGKDQVLCAKPILGARIAWEVGPLRGKSRNGSQIKFIKKIPDRSTSSHLHLTFTTHRLPNCLCQPLSRITSRPASQAPYRNFSVALKFTYPSTTKSLHQPMSVECPRRFPSCRKYGNARPYCRIQAGNDLVITRKTLTSRMVILTYMPAVWYMLLSRSRPYPNFGRTVRSNACATEGDCNAIHHEVPWNSTCEPSMVRGAGPPFFSIAAAARCCDRNISDMLKVSSMQSCKLSIFWSCLRTGPYHATGIDGSLQ